MAINTPFKCQINAMASSSSYYTPVDFEAALARTAATLKYKRMPSLPQKRIKVSEQARVYRYLFLSQTTLYLTLAVCVLLAPSSLGANGGISYFGTHHLTAVPFIAGIFTSAYFLWRAQRQLDMAANGGILARAFQIIIPAMVGIAIAPAVGNGWLDIMHRIFGTLVFVTELVLAFWMAFLVKKTSINCLLFIVQLAGGLVAFYYLAPARGFSIEGQLLFQAAFTALLFRNLKTVLGRGTTGPSR